RQRAAALRARPLPRHRRLHLEEHRESTSAERLAGLIGEHGAAAERDHRRLAVPQRRGGHPGLTLAQPRFAVAREELLDRDARLALDLPVQVDEGTPQTARDLGSERRLPRAHEARKGEVAVQRVLGHWMRSRYARCAPTKSTIASPPNFSLALQ